MSYNGSGTFLINTAGQPVVSGTVISSTTFNTLTNDLANGLSTAITKDGQTTITNNIPFNGYKITNVGAGTAATDAVQLGQVQSGSFTALTVTGTDTYVASVTPVLPAYTTGSMFTFVVPNTNTGPATLNVSSLGAKVLSRDGSTALAAGDLVAGSEVIVVYDGTRFQVLNSNSKTNLTVSGNATLSGGTANGVAYLNGSKVLTTGSGLTYNSSGNLAIATPSGGVAFTANQAASSVVGVRIASNGSGTDSAILSLFASGIREWQIKASNSAGAFLITDVTRGADVISASSSGAVSITAPSSGTAFTVNGIDEVIRLTTTAARGTGRDYISFVDPTGSKGYLGYPTATDDVYWNNQLSSINLLTAGSIRMTVGLAGGVSINAPNAGTNAFTVNSIGGATSGLVVIGAASQTGANISTSTPSGTTNYWRIGQNSIVNWDIQNVATSGVLQITNGSYTPFQATQGGNVTINAPSSGNTLAVAGVASGTALTVTNSTSGSGSEYFQSWSNGTDANLFVRISQVGAATKFSSIESSTATPINIGTNSTTRLVVGAAGNVTINAPTSGTALALGSGSGVAWAAGQYAIQVGPIASVRGDSGTAAFSNNTYFDGTNWKYITTAAATRYEQNGGANTWLWAASGTGGTTAGTWNTSLNIGSAGNVTINAPASGNSLVVNAVAGGAAGAFYAPASNTCSLYLYGNNGAGSLLLQGGNDNNGYITASNTLYLASNNLSRVSLGTTGTVTVLAPTSGSALVVNGSASTPPVAVTFSATAMTVNTNLSNVFTTTFTANVTTAPTISNPTDGQTINWFITQDATGTRTMTWPTSFKWPNGVAGVLSTAANAVDLVVATYRSSTGFWYASLAKGFA